MMVKIFCRRLSKRSSMNMMMRGCPGTEYFSFFMMIFPLICCVFSFLIIQSSHAQQNPVSAQSLYGQVFTTEKIKAKIREIENSKDIDETLKTRVLDSYKRALGNLESADTYNSAAESFSRSVKISSNEIAELERKIRLVDASGSARKDSDFMRMSVQDLDQKLTLARADFGALREEEASLDDTLQNERNRPAAIRDEIAAARQGIREISNEIISLKGASDSPLLIEARRMALLTGRFARAREITMLNRELSSYSTRLQVLTVRKTLISRIVAVNQQQLADIERAVKEKRQAEVEKTEKALEISEKTARGKDPEIYRLTVENIRLAKELSSVVSAGAKASSQLDTIRSQARQVEQSYRNARQKLDVGSTSRSIGRILADERRKLFDVRNTIKDYKNRQKEIADIWLREIRVEESIRPQNELDREIARLTGEIAPQNASHEKKREIESELRELIREQQTLLSRLSSAYTNYLGILGNLESALKLLIDITARYRTFLDEWVLWLPNRTPFTIPVLVENLKSIQWSFSLSHGKQITDAYISDITSSSVIWLLFVAGICVLLVLRRRAWKVLRSVNSDSDRFRTTLQIFLCTVIIAGFVPVIVCFAGWRLAESHDAGDFARSAGNALLNTASAFFLLRMLYHMCLNRMLTEVHFGWNRRLTGIIMRELRWYSPVFFVLLFSIFLFSSLDDPYRDPGQLPFILLMAVSAVASHRILKKRPDILSELEPGTPGSLFWPIRSFLHILTVGSLIVLAAVAGAGYLYTSLQLLHHLWFTLWLYIAAIVVDSFLLTWFTLAGRKIARRDGVHPKKPAQEESHRETKDTPAVDGVSDADVIDFGKIDRQTRKLTHAVIGVVLIIGTILIWSKLFPAFSVLGTVTLWSHPVTVGGKETQIPVTLLNLAAALFIGALTVVFVRNVPGLLDVYVLRNLPISAANRYAITNLVRYSLTALGIVIFFTSLGGSWSQIQWLVAALGVGLGFGLQEIFGNLVAGLIILFEKPVRVGDTVTIGNVSGKVIRINMRATTIMDFDNKELIVPNKMFITGQLVNWNLSDPVTRVTISVGIAYGSDTDLAYRIMLDTVKANPSVLGDPDPKVFFTGFGDSALNFTIYVFVADLSQRLPVTHAIHMELDRALRDHGIEVPFPQRDVHIRTKD